LVFFSWVKPKIASERMRSAIGKRRDRDKGISCASDEVKGTDVYTTWNGIS
jgi:hypothetical protein